MHSAAPRGLLTSSPKETTRETPPDATPQRACPVSSPSQGGDSAPPPPGSVPVESPFPKGLLVSCRLLEPWAATEDAEPRPHAAQWPASGTAFLTGQKAKGLEEKRSRPASLTAPSPGQAFPALTAVKAAPLPLQARAGATEFAFLAPSQMAGVTSSGTEKDLGATCQWVPALEMPAAVGRTQAHLHSGGRVSTGPCHFGLLGGEGQQRAQVSSLRSEGSDTPQPRLNPGME